MTQENTSTSQAKSVKNPSQKNSIPDNGNGSSQGKSQPYLGIVDRAMAAHPGLTREEAERMLEELGYY